MRNISVQSHTLDNLRSRFALKAADHGQWVQIDHATEHLGSRRLGASTGESDSDGSEWRRCDEDA